MANGTGVKNRRLLIAKNSIMMLVVLVIIFLAIFAWYFIQRSVSATGISVSAAQPENVQIALPGNDDKLPIESAFSDNVNFGDSKLIKDVTSDGEQFVVPAFDTTDGSNNVNGKTVLTAGDWTDGLSSRTALTNDDESDDEKYNYVSLDFYLRSSSPKISLCEDSYLAARAELQGGNNATISNASLDAEQHGPDDITFSRDALVGAMRVSLQKFDVEIDNNGTEGSYNRNPMPTLLWLPRPDIYVDTTNASPRSWTLTYVTPTNTSYNYKTYRHTFYHGETIQGTGGGSDVKRGVTETTYYDDAVTPDLSSGATSPDYFKVTKISSDDEDLGTSGHYPTFGQTAQIASGGTLIPRNSIKNYPKDWYIYRMRLNVWIEGADAEARRAMNDGQFKLHLEFR